MNELHREHSGAILRYVRSLARIDRNTAEDLVQETMLRTWRNIGALPAEPESARRWVFTVARRATIDHIRMRNARVTEISTSDLNDTGTRHDPTAIAIAAHALRQAARELSGPHRTVIHEMYLKGVPAADLALRLGVPVSTVKSRAHHAMRTLRAAVQS